MAMMFSSKILGLNIGIFGTSSRQSQTVLRVGFDPEIDVFGFCCVFWYHNDCVTNGTKKTVHNLEGIERCPVFMGPRLRPFCVFLLD